MEYSRKIGRLEKETQKAFADRDGREEVEGRGLEAPIRSFTALLGSVCYDKGNI
jgi:hypothetical protein